MTSMKTEIKNLANINHIIDITRPVIFLNEFGSVDSNSLHISYRLIKSRKVNLTFKNHHQLNSSLSLNQLFNKTSCVIS